MKVVFLGGRQAETVCRIYRLLSGASDNAQWLDPYQKSWREKEDEIASADILALQARGTRLGVDLDEIGAKGERVWFPEISLDFLWPFGGQPHVVNTRDEVFPEGPFPIELGDAYLNRRLQGRQRAEAIEEAYLALDVAAVLDLDAYKRMVLQRQAEIDNVCRSDFTTLIETQFRERQLFLNPLNPTPALVRALANPLFRRLPGGFSLTEDWRSDGALASELPIHPSVAAHFGLAWAKDRLYRACNGERIGFPEYVRRYLAYAEGPELEVGLRLVAQGRSEDALAKLERAAARPMGRRSAFGQRGLAHAFAATSHGEEALAALNDARSTNPEGEENELSRAVAAAALGRWREAAAQTLAFLESSPRSTEAWLLLASIREKLGDSEGRIAALRQAIAARPDDPGLQSRLTLALAAVGDWRGAVVSAEREVVLNPENPHSRAFLSAMLERLGEKERAKSHLARALEIISVGSKFAGLRDELAKRQMAIDAAIEVTDGAPAS